MKLGVIRGCRPARPGRARLGMTLEPLLGSTALYRADTSWDTSSRLIAGCLRGRYLVVQPLMKLALSLAVIFRLEI